MARGKFGRDTIEIREVENGYILWIDSSLAPSRVFEKLEDAVEYIRAFFTRGRGNNVRT